MPPADRPVHRQAVLMLLLATAYWGLSFPLVKAIGLAHLQVLPGSGTWFITAYTIAPRFLIATLILLAVLAPQLGTFTRLELKQGVLLGLMLGAGMLLQNDGLQFTSASTSAFLTQVYAILIPAWIALRSRRSPPGIVWLCGALVLAGVAVLGRFNFRELHFGRGEWETLASALFFMVHILVLGQKEYAANRTLPVTLVMFATEAVAFTAMAWGTAPDAAALLAPWASGPWLGFTVLVTVVCTLGSFILMNRWQPKITTTEAGLIYCVEPVFASLMALFLPALFSAWGGFNYPNEQLTWHLLAGGGLITLANIIIQLKPPPPEPG